MVSSSKDSLRYDLIHPTDSFPDGMVRRASSKAIFSRGRQLLHELRAKLTKHLPLFSYINSWDLPLHQFQCSQCTSSMCGLLASCITPIVRKREGGGKEEAASNRIIGSKARALLVVARMVSAVLSCISKKYLLLCRVVEISERGSVL